MIKFTSYGILEKIINVWNKICDKIVHGLNENEKMSEAKIFWENDTVDNKH